MGVPGRPVAAVKTKAVLVRTALDDELSNGDILVIITIMYYVTIIDMLEPPRRRAFQR